MSVEFYCFLPQMRMGFDELVARAQAAEEAGFDGLALMDHLAPPAAEQQPMTDAMVTAAWLLAHTERLRVGHLVLCDAFRHPAVLARQAVSLDHASQGRFDLGLGWGSVPHELEAFGVTAAGPRERVARLDESLSVIRALWSGEPVSFSGVHHQLDDVTQRPGPSGTIPIVVGGAGPRTLEVVERHADWWNCPSTDLDRFDELRPQVPDARASVQLVVTYVADPTRRREIEQQAERRFGFLAGGLMTGDAAELVDQLGALADRGVERFYLWLTDFAAPETLAALGAEVLTPIRAT